MNAAYPFQKSPRCAATSKRTKLACQAPAVNGWAVCRFHGARGGAPTGKRNGAYKHGLHMQEAAALNARLTDLQRESRALLRRLMP